MTEHTVTLAQRRAAHDVMTVKIALLAAVIFFVYSMIKKRNHDGESEVEVGEIEVDAED